MGPKAFVTPKTEDEFLDRAEGITLQGAISVRKTLVERRDAEYAAKTNEIEFYDKVIELRRSEREKRKA